MSSEMRKIVADMRLYGGDKLEGSRLERLATHWADQIEAVLARTEAGAKCDHTWQPDSDVMNARYCPKCDVTQTIPKKTTHPQDASGDAVAELIAAADVLNTGAKHGLSTYPEDWKRLDAALNAMQAKEAK